MGRKTQNQHSAGDKRSRWFWVGVALLSMSALAWLGAIIATALEEPENVVDAIVGAVALTAIPIGIGIYCIWRGKKAASIEAERQHAEGVYPSEPLGKTVREAKSKAYSIEMKGFLEKHKKKHKTIIGVIGFIIGLIIVLAWVIFDFVLEQIFLD